MLLGLCSCDKAFTDPLTRERHTRVQLTVASCDVCEMSRTTDENTIEDINIYLIGRDETNYLHMYTASPTLNFELSPGRYDLFVIANSHHDLGSLSVSQLSELTFPIQEIWDDIPMSATRQIIIPASKGLHVLPTISVERQLARITCGISVYPTASAIKLKSVCLCNVPRVGYLFDDASPDNSDDAYCTYGYTEAPENRTSMMTSFYIPSNCQGTIPTIAAQQQKNEDNAPSHATYLLIHATRGPKILTYRVYLGENNTTDFNVRKNTCHTLMISIRGINEVDTRISSYTVAVRDDMDGNKHGGYCVDDGSPKHLYIQVESTGTPPELLCTVDVTAGDAEAFTVAGKPAGTQLSVINNGSANCFQLNYAPTLFDNTNKQLDYRVTVRDKYGFSQIFDLTHLFANSLTVYVKGNGTVAATSALYSTDMPGIANGLLVLCNRCSLKATAMQGAKFDGWYADEACSMKLSAATSYAYTAKNRTQTLYAKFVMSDHTPLDTDGTANCYITPKLLAGYSFDATVMGKGEWSTNIQPKRLSGTTAKVIWESEPRTDDAQIIRYVILENGRIYFSTGSIHGNALIGLFDKNGTCIWSWHIWVTDYNPSDSAQTYGSGYTFMNRNLGVLSGSMTERGLYYQWGRKDPFIYPMSSLPGTTAKTTYNLDGYEFRVYGQNSGSAYTVTWATANPTTFLSRTFQSTNIGSWLESSNPNLWGNSTNGSAASKIGRKSIYDPCPPGWMVPPRRAWDAATFRDANFELSYGRSLYYSSTEARTFYPYNGCLTGDNGYMQYKNSLSEVYVWTSEPYLTSTNDSSYCIRIVDGTPYLSATNSQQKGCAVRCIKEQ